MPECPSDAVATTSVSLESLRTWPLPIPSEDGDKETRGHVLIIGGSHEMPGAVILAATAALRAGAGKLTIATGASVAQLVALAIPESRVMALPETPQGGITAEAAERFNKLAEKVDAVLVGPGMQDEQAICRFVLQLLPKLGATKVVLDASAMGVVRDMAALQAAAGMAQPDDAPPSLLLTPHAGEMAYLTGQEKQRIVDDPCHSARTAARRWNAVVALKGSTTYVASPGQQAWRHVGGNIGLAISGSGDTLAGIICGLLARGAALEQAGVWGVALHARAGELLAARMGSLGYLAREIAAEVPALLDLYTERQ